MASQHADVQPDVTAHEDTAAGEGNVRHEDNVRHGGTAGRDDTAGHEGKNLEEIIAEQEEIFLRRQPESARMAARARGSLAGGVINSIKDVSIGQLKYIVGDAYPFRWFNAGDFGNTNLENADVEQVFQSAIYHIDYPPSGSDFFDAMDSCGSIGVLDWRIGI